MGTARDAEDKGGNGQPTYTSNKEERGSSCSHQVRDGAQSHLHVTGLKKAGAGLARLGPALQGCPMQLFHSDTDWESCRMWEELEKELEGQPEPLVRILLRGMLYIEVRIGTLVRLQL